MILLNPRRASLIHQAISIGSILPAKPAINFLQTMLKTLD